VLAGNTAACDPAIGAEEAVPPAVAELASATALAGADMAGVAVVADTAGTAGVAARAAALAALAAAALTCATPLAAPVLGVEAGAVAAEPADATPADDAASAPEASSAGTVNTAPTRIRLGSWLMKALGFASNNAREARARVARSCDCVTAIATSFSDCPGRTVN
jgi:hypothetical protein